MKRAIIVGGDFSKDTISTNNCVLVDFIHIGKYAHPITNPHGYRSCVIYFNGLNLIACGTSGIDISIDEGWNWQLISKTGFNVVQKAKKGNAVFLAGGDGRIARLQ